MTIDCVIARLQQENKRLASELRRVRQAIHALRGVGRNGLGPHGRRRMSASARRRIAAAQRARWAKWKAKQKG